MDIPVWAVSAFAAAFLSAIGWGVRTYFRKLEERISGLGEDMKSLRGDMKDIDKRSREDMKGIDERLRKVQEDVAYLRAHIGRIPGAVADKGPPTAA